MYVLDPGSGPAAAGTMLRSVATAKANDLESLSLGPEHGIRSAVHE